MENHRFRENISDKGLRSFFNEKNHTPNKRYKPDDYTRLRNEYFKLLDKHREDQKRNKRLQVRNQRKAEAFLASLRNAADIYAVKRPARDTSKPKMTMAKLGKYVEYWYKKNKDNNTHFSIKLQSRVAPDVKNIFKFNSIYHFMHWFEKVKTQTYELSSESWGNVLTPSDDDFYNLFQDVVVDNIKFIGGGCNKHAAGEKKIKTSFYSFKLHNPQSMNNNCFFKCLEYVLKSKLHITSIRKQFDLATSSEVGIDDAYRIFQHYQKNIIIIDEDYNEELEEGQQYFLLNNNHYYVVQSWEEIIRKERKTKRGLMTFDFETRKTSDYHLIVASNTKSYILKDALCCVYYKPYKTNDMLEKVIVTSEKTSARQFLDFLNKEAECNRSYNVVAHNGGKFDFYFLIAVMTEQEIKDADIQMRGTTIISLNYRGNLFKDSCCFLTDSLANLSSSFKIAHGKIVKMELHGEEISSSQLCFYKPFLTFNEFLDLQTTDVDYWKLYVKYCMHDCIALYEIWQKFGECINSLIEKIDPYLLRKCPLMSSSTIGSHSKKILVEINKFDGKISYDRQNLQRFIGMQLTKQVREGKELTDKQEWHINKGTELGKTLEKTHMVMTETYDIEKYKFLCNFKRGGISTCNQAGKHDSGITGVDIASQYPASLIYSYIPTGISRWINFYDKDTHGFYHLSNLVFENNYALKPVASININKTLNWASNNMEELFVDSYMLKYIIENFGLKSFHVVKGLVSNYQIASSKIFGKYINTFYKEKQHQDELKDKNDASYNPALRTTIKLYLNSLTGKLVENPNVHFSLKSSEEGKISLNGVGVSKEFHEDKINDWITCGIMVYSYSKRLLFEYIKCLPDKSNDVIHIETDGIYFSTRHLEAFTKNLDNYEGDFPCKFGENLGNLKIEKTTFDGQVAYFLGKKFYCITMPDGKNIMRIKGIPQSTIDEYGRKIQLVDTELYEDVYAGKSRTKEFQTLRKALFTQQTHISSHVIKRTINPNQKYSYFI